ncbi:N-acyl-D-amino-acid deacylase family protein [Zavarzinella formosa]|uniref:N-acyl-D-amino-acid deacylase family protein n=1 Tax=Zavarzinella formosa TaxID=360055 RepID=UPI0002F65D56|nr:D-aminoacylase [Zavarzinella formosa]
MLNTIVLMLGLFGAEPPPAMDVVIRGATLYDGSGKPGVIGDIAIAGERIVAIGKVEVVGKPREIDGKSLVVAPGFIDLHTHCDTGAPTIAQSTGKLNKNYLTQGVTTVVTGNCGSGPVNAKDFYDKLDKNGIGTNVAHLATHNSIRSVAMGNSNRAPTAEELAKMEQLVDQAMKDGVWGLSTGLIYTPGTYSETTELIALAKVAAKHKGMYTSHIRDEGSGLLNAIGEALRIGREAKLPVHISHIKASGKGTWGRSGDAVSLIKKAIADGQEVTADQYPYIASSTSLSATVIPSRFRDGTSKEYKDRLGDPEKGEQIRKAVDAAMKSRDGGKTIQIARYGPNPKWQGKNLKEIAEAEKKSSTDIVIEIEKNGGAGVVNFGMSEEDVRVYMKQPFVATASDGSVHLPGATVPHPRSYGTFPRKIGRYCLADGLLPLEQAIRSSSGLPADILHLPERGYLKPGYFADVVVFDPKTFKDTATYDKPHQYAEGVKYLFVNGKMVIDGGEVKEVFGGKALRHAPK